MNSSTEQNVLLGQSMGGVIGRYCLAKMEEDLETHDVRLFVAHDSPMQGANVPISIQHFTRHINDLYVDAPVHGLIETFIPAILNFIDLMDMGLLGDIDTFSPEDYLTIQDTPAALQLNYHYVTFQSNETEAAHLAWQNELEAMGYPQQCRNIAISNGNECAVDHGFDPRDKFINMRNVHNPGTFGQLIQYIVNPLLSIAIDDIELLLIGLLPGSGKYFFDFDLHANPKLSDTERQIYYGKIRYEKKLLWLIKISHTITSRTKDAPSNYLPFDTFSGGFTNIEAVIDTEMFGDIFVNPKYGFIPVVSALDIKRNNVNVDPDDYLLKYAGGTTPDPQLTSPFDNFIVGYSNSFINEPHITFNARNGSWLADEIDVNPITPEYPVRDCSYLCNDSEISGDVTICSLGVYSIPGSPVQMYYQWSIIEGDDLVTLTDGTTSEITLTVNPEATGLVIIQLIYGDANYRCNPLTLTKDIWVGKPIFENFTCSSLGEDFCSGEVAIESSELPLLSANNRAIAHFAGLTPAEAFQNSNWDWAALNNKVSVSKTKNVGFIGIGNFGIT